MLGAGLGSEECWGCATALKRVLTPGEEPLAVAPFSSSRTATTDRDHSLRQKDGEALFERSTSRLSLFTSCRQDLGLEIAIAGNGNRWITLNTDSPGNNDAAVATHAFVQIPKDGSSTLKYYAQTFFNGTADQAFHEFSPDLKLLAFVRDPIERFRSGALEIVNRGYSFNGVDGVTYARLRGGSVALSPAQRDNSSLWQCYAAVKPEQARQELDTFQQCFRNGSLEYGDWCHLQHQMSFLTYKPRGTTPASSPVTSPHPLTYLGMTDSVDTELDSTPPSSIKLERPHTRLKTAALPHLFHRALAAIFGTDSSGMHQRSNKDLEVAAQLDGLMQKSVCRIYWEDAICLDSSFRARCEALGASFPVDDVSELRQAYPWLRWRDPSWVRHTFRERVESPITQ